MLHTQFRVIATSATVAALLLAGCGDKSHQTVDWYKAHEAERTEKLAWCNNDAARATDVDCLNASKAKELAMLSGPGAADTFKFDKNQVPTNQASSAPSTQQGQAPKHAGKSAADTFEFKPDPKLFPNAAASKGGK